MKIIEAKNKYPKSETEPYNPWAVCNESTGGKKKDPAAFERCVHHVKDQNREDGGETKAVRTVDRRQFRSDGVGEDEFDRRFQNFDQNEQDEEQRRDDKWRDLLMRQKQRREPAFASWKPSKKLVITAKKDK